VQRRFPSRQGLANTAPAPADGRRLFATNLRRLRRATHLTQEQLAEAAGLDRSFVSLIENARANVSLDNMCRIAAAVGVRPDELLRPTDES
jgi:transcriptional regulator with XRE-family HTH domain